jgi:hypothetical protein
MEVRGCGWEIRVRIEPGTPTQTLVGPPIHGSSPHFGPNQSSDIAITPAGTPYARRRSGSPPCGSRCALRGPYPLAPAGPARPVPRAAVMPPSTG